MQLTAITSDFTTKNWKRSPNYLFAAKSNVLPVVVSELARLVPAMPLGFVKDGDVFKFVAITSLQHNTNLFVAPDGSWIVDYIPAVIRSYPFHLVKPQDREDLVLCFDTDSGLLCEVGEGEPFYDGDEPSQLVKMALNLLSETETSRVVTQRFVNALQETELIQPWPLNIQEGEKTTKVEGLYRIDETALNALPDEDFLTLRKSGALGLAYGQLLSTNQLSVLSKAAQVQTKIKEQVQALAASQAQNLSDTGFRMSSSDDTFKF
ncbi:SapC [mine drainage metagenome]|uniref:SapC n=1 Tax=mine drainage metagenome TaxID=410659 RepID=A0A1J5QBZ1_9ZZZZ